MALPGLKEHYGNTKLPKKAKDQDKKFPVGKDNTGGKTMDLKKKLALRKTK